MKYEVGDKVQIKDINWYNENKNEDGDISCGEFNFVSQMSKFCGKILTIDVDFEDGTYLMKEDTDGFVFTIEMIDCLVERNGKTYPYKIGDRVLLKGNNRCATITDLKYNSWGNLSYYIKIDNDKDISIDYPTDLLLPYDNMVEGLVKDECPQDFIEKYCKSCGTQRCDRTKEFLDGCPYYNAYMCKKQNNAVEEETKPEPKFKVGDRIYPKYHKPSNDLEIIEVIRGDGHYGYRIKNHHTNNTYYMWEYEMSNYKLAKEEIKSEDELLNEYEELTDRAFKGGYEKCKSDIELNGFQLPDGYIFKDENGNIINAQKIVLEKKGNRYPKTHEECSAINGAEGRISLSIIGKFTRLINARNAYWRIAGQEMGLGKPWKPDWNIRGYYAIARSYGNVVKTSNYNCDLTFVFPTEEMRDAFYEAFREEIEICKEFL